MKEPISVSTHFNSGLKGNHDDLQLAIWLYEKRKRSVQQIAKVFKCSASTVARALKANDIEITFNNKASGQNHGMWEGGKTKTAEHIRFTPEYKQWRKQVFERDDYTCTWCGQRGGELQADHIKPQCAHPELILDLDNGRTLCKSCHRKTDTWGQGAKKYKLIVADYTSGK